MAIGVAPGAIYHSGCTGLHLRLLLHRTHSIYVFVDAVVFRFSDLYRTRKADARRGAVLFLPDALVLGRPGAATLPARIAAVTRMLHDSASVRANTVGVALQA